MIGLDHKLSLGQSPSQSHRISRPRNCLQTRIRCVAPVNIGSRTSKKTANLDAVIVGGGLAGLSAAVGLQSIGLNFKVLERAEELHTSTGTVIGLGANAFYALEQLDQTGFIATELRRIGLEPTKVSSYGGPSGQHALVQSLNFKPGTWHLIHWSLVQDTLASLVPQDSILCSQNVTGFTEHEDLGCVDVHVKGDEDIRAGFLVIAEGVGSVLRSQLIPGDRPRYTGDMTWNSVQKFSSEVRAKVHEPRENVIHKSSHGFTAKLQAIMGDMAGENTFWGVQLSIDQIKMTNESWPRGGLGVTGSKARVLDLVRAEGWEDVLAAIEATPEGEIFERALHDRTPPPHWVSAAGRVVLVGDAAHAMHPGPGMGGRMAFEDAHQLMVALQKEQDVPTALRAFEAVRIPRVEKVHRMATRAAGSASVRESAGWGFAEGFSQAEWTPIAMEFQAWVNSYPHKMGGDPDSRFWA